MRPSHFVALMAAGAAAVPKPCDVSYARLMTDSMVRYGVNPSYRYDQATLYTTMELMYAHTENQTLYDWYRGQVDSVVFDNGTIRGLNRTHYSLDSYRFGNNLLWWYQETGEEKYRIGADTIKGMLDNHPRTPLGGFWHRDTVYPNQMWLDGIYMADTFYARWVSLFQPENTTAWDDVALQYDLIDLHTRRDNGLRVHGYDESKVAVWADPENGAAPLVWGRALGWYVMTLLEAIELFPEDHPGRGRIVGYFQDTARGLKATQDEKGAWYNIMDDQYVGVKGNYLESSASSMFTFAWLKALRMGVIEKSDYLDVARKAYKALIDLFVTYNQDGTINFEETVFVGSLGSNGSFEVCWRIVEITY